MITTLSLSAQETQLHPAQIDDAGATSNQVLTWNGTEWVPADIPAGSDNQVISLNGTTLSLEDGGSVDLTPFLDNTDDQQLSLASNTLSLEDGGSVDLSTYLDNTDTQTLSYNASTGAITISNGNSQTITIGQLWTTEIIDVATAGSTLTISGSIGSSITEAVTISRNGLVQRIGNSSMDVSISSSTLTFNQRDLEIGELIVVKYPSN